MSESLPIPADQQQFLPTLLRPVASSTLLIEAHKEGVEVLQKVLQEGTDYGVIPGTGDKPTLLKPGAERLMTAFGMYADSVILEMEVDHDRVNTFKLTKWVAAKSKPAKDVQDEMKASGLGRFRKSKDGGWEWQEAVIEQGESQGIYRYVVKSNIIHRQTGMIVASGVGSCSSMETKYIRSPRDFENTVLKMAKKRSFIDGTLNALGLSDRFTQDVEDIPVEGPREREKDGTRLETEMFLKNIYGGNIAPGSDAAKDVASLKDLVRARGGKFLDMVKESMEAGVQTPVDLRSYIEDGTIVGLTPEAETPIIVDQAPAVVESEIVDAEIVDEDEKTAGALSV